MDDFQLYDDQSERGSSVDNEEENSDNESVEVVEDNPEGERSAPSYPLVLKFNEGTEKLCESTELFKLIEPVVEVYHDMISSDEDIDFNRMTTSNWIDFLRRCSVPDSLFKRATKLLKRVNKGKSSHLKAIELQRRYIGKGVKAAQTRRIFQQALEQVMLTSEIEECKSVSPAYIHEIIWKNKYHIATSAVEQLQCFADGLIINLFKAAKLIANTRRKQTLEEWKKDHPTEDPWKGFYKARGKKITPETVDIQEGVTKVPEKLLTPKDLRAASDISFIMSKNSSPDIYDRMDWVCDLIPREAPKRKRNGDQRPSLTQKRAIYDRHRTTTNTAEIDSDDDEANRPSEEDPEETAHGNRSQSKKMIEAEEDREVIRRSLETAKLETAKLPSGKFPVLTGKKLKSKPPVLTGKKLKSKPPVISGKKLAS